ncbi:MAG: hypothetical protein ACXW1D_00195 [Halobacteriota archaeon]
MATRKAATNDAQTNTINFDIAEFRRQKQLMEQHASTGIAERIAQIEALIGEIKDLAELSGNNTLRLGGEYGLLARAIEGVDSLHEDWNSSSYDC